MQPEKIIGLFVNPLPGKSKASKMSAAIQSRLAMQQISFAVYDETWPDVVTGITEGWIIGGDGTLNYFINKYKDISLPLAIFPAGTGNDFSWKLYGNINTEELIDLVLNAPVRKVDAGQCNELLYLVGVGIGFEGAVLKSMKSVRFLGGHAGYLWAVVKVIFGFKELHFDIDTGKEKLSDKFLLVIVNNSSRTGGGFMVAPTAKVDDGLLDIVLCKKLKLFKRLRSLPVIEKGKHLGLPYIIHKQESSAIIICEKEVSAHLDGELICAKEFRFTALPQHFLFRY